MISRTTINRILASALFLAAFYIVLIKLLVFRGEPGWVEYSVLAVACILFFIAVFPRLRRRAERRKSVKASRDSLLKHLWELRHRREW